MELTIDAKLVTKTIGILRDFVGSRTDLGSFIRLDVTDSVFSLSAMDESTYTTLSLPLEDFGIDVTREGSVFVKADAFLRIIVLVHPVTAEGTGCSFVVLSDTDQAFQISYDTIYRGGSLLKNSRSIPKDYGNKFPAVAPIEKPSFSIESSDLKRCLKKAHFLV